MKIIYTMILFISVIIITGCNADNIPDLEDNNQDVMDNPSDIQDATNNSTEVIIVQDEPSLLASYVQYYGNTTGYMVRPDDNEEYPGIIMIHEWWGLNKNIRDMADELASEGYVVLAVDLYNGNVANTSEEARTLVGSINQSIALDNLNAAYDILEEKGSPQIGSLGWCFGGGQSMQLALNNSEIDATVIYYGNLETNASRLSNITWPILGIFGDQDTSIPVSKVMEFESVLNTNMIKNEIYVYPDVGHAFANPTGTNYAPIETVDAWNKTIVFLETYLKE